jgi:hypothetical protein
MKRLQWMFTVALVVSPSACALQATGEEDASVEELGVKASGSGIADKAKLAGATPIAEALADAALERVSLADPFDDAEIQQDASSFTFPKPPWPFTCQSGNDNPVSFSLDGPDGGACLIKGTAANCRLSGEICTCDVAGETRSGDCKDDDSTTTFTDPPQTQGTGL